jgi:c-di-GMP-binding flagellar brake protein YcgR
LEEYLVTKEEKGTKPHYGTVNFERRNPPSFNVDLPIEFSRTDLFVKHGRAVNASEGGLLLSLPEKMEIGQHLSLKLFFTSDFELDAIEIFVEVSWRDIHLGEGEGDYRTGVRFVEISMEDMGKLKNFLRSLSG